MFYTGIVENRDDPLRLDRLQVRIFGVHTESLEDIPTKDLPWALAMSDSASISGIGKSGSKYVPGTMVFLFFQDGESKQQPVIFGAVPMTPLGKSPFGNIESTTITTSSPATQTSTVQATSPGVVQDSSGAPVIDSSGAPVVTSTDSRSALKAALGFKESSNNYKAVNQFNYIGKYQMGAAMLTDLGYVKKGTTNKDLDNPSCWTGKNGITSKDNFLNNPSGQETAMNEELDLNEKRLNKMGVIDSTTTEQEKAGYLATSHLLGTGGARDMKNGITKKDGNGVTGQVYYALGYKSVSGKEPTITPQAATPDNPSREASTNPSVGSTVTRSSNTASTSYLTNNGGFTDPSGQYPRYLEEQDTNRLARNQNIGKTIVPIKEETEDKNVSIAGGGSWDQSKTPYNAKYPLNSVMETESGHVMEFDDTPNNERMNFHHRTGTFQEWDRNGTEVRKIVGDKYEIWERNGYVHIMGTCNITVEGNANIRVANNVELEIDGNLNAVVGGNVDWSVGGSWKVKTGGIEHHTNGGTFAVDAPQVYFNSGRSSAGSLASPSGSATGAPSFDALYLEPRGFEKLAQFEGDELSAKDAADFQAQLEKEGLVDLVKEPAKMDETKTEKVVPNKVTALPVSCGMFVSGKINIEDYVSPNFRLKALTLGRSIPLTQAGLQDTEIACNLKAVAENILEPIKKKYPDMIITSGLREPGKNAKSQHPLGEAIDIQFTTKKSSDYLAICKDLSATLSYDQLILEYRTSVSRNGAPQTWIHVSFSRKGNKKQLFTMNNDARVGDFGELRMIT